MSDRQSGVTSAASKHSGLSCRWALVLQRSGKKWHIFYFTVPGGDYVGDEQDGIWFPSACLLLLLPTEKIDISHLLCLQIPSFHPSYMSRLLFKLVPHFISPHPPSNGNFSPWLTSQRTYLPVRASTCLPAAPPDHLCRTPTSHCARQLSSVLSSW